MTFILLFFINLITLLTFNSQPASAQCPVCIVTVGGGMLIAKKLGVDDFLVSIWISALNTAIAFYLANKINPTKNGPNGSMVKWLNFLKNPWLLSFIFLLFTLLYFVSTGQTGHLNNKILGLDKIIFGQTLGMLVMFKGNFIYGFAKFKNGGKALFPYSKVIFPVGLVLLTTFIFKLIFKL